MWIKELEMSAQVESSILDHLDEYLEEPDEVVWAKRGEEQAQMSKTPPKALWGRTADAIASQQRAEQAVRHSP
jgi:hypothetical protein